MEMSTSYPHVNRSSIYFKLIIGAIVFKKLFGRKKAPAETREINLYITAKYCLKIDAKAERDLSTAKFFSGQWVREKELEVIHIFSTRV
jgi:hypothetical protein